MPGMSTGLNANNPTIVSAFYQELLYQGLVVLLVLALVWVAWRLLRLRQLHLAATGGASPRVGAVALSGAEPAARRLLRTSFGFIWVFDGILQGQPSMPLGMAPDVIEPAAAASPAWVRHLDNAMATVWSYHPIAAPAAAVWIQVGIGIFLLVAPRGTLSRLAGVASAGWGLVVWVFGEAFGGVFAPGLTWLFGAPGAVLFYCVAGGLVALPERYWGGPRLGRLVLRAMGLFFVGMALLQAWPGRGFWQGQSGPHAPSGTLTSMLQQMASTPQPHLFSSWISAFSSFDAAHGWAVNLFVVTALAAVGASFLTARPRLAGAGVVAGAVLCLADWVLVEDFGFFGGVGTDPNSMIPMSLVFLSGYLATTRLPTAAPATVASASAAGDDKPSWRERLAGDPTYTFRSVAALGAIAVILVGAVPMSMAAVNPNASAILDEAVNGVPQAEDLPAPAFHLINQDGTPVSLGSFRGKVVALTELDPVCISTCPVIAQELREADGLLGADAARVDFVAINGNPQFISPDYLRAFDQQEGLNNLPNWTYLTGATLPELGRVLRAYGFEDDYLPGGAMILHSTLAFVIDATGRVRYVLNTDPGPTTEATQSSVSVTLADTIKRVLAFSPRTERAAPSPGIGTNSSSLASDTPGFTPVPPQLATSLQTPEGTWAIVPMGRLDDASNTFWQLFFEPAGAGSWSDKVGPTATATNGGLVMATSPGQPFVVGILPSYDLRFTPIIATADSGKSWSTGLLDKTMAVRPNALAVGPGGRALSIAVTKGADQVLESSGGLSSWRTLLTEGALRSEAPGRRCAPSEMTAVGYVGATALVGTSCSRSGVAGLFAHHGGAWELTEPPMPRSFAHGHIDVLGLSPRTGALAALAEASSSRGTYLLAWWTTDGRTWQSSPSLKVATGQHLVSYGPAGRNGLFVLLAAPAGTEQLDVVDGPGAAWHHLPPPPVHTATVASVGNGVVDALAVDGTLLTVWALPPSSTTWVRSQVVHVHILFGSSNP